MNEFAADWLALREPADHAARSPGLARRLRPLLDRRPAIRAIDLGCGSGSNVRWLGPRLPRPQNWLLVDGDPALLEIATAAAPRCQALRLDLASGLDRLDFASADLVTGSALLDLVTEGWLANLFERLAATPAVLLFALTVDGRIAWQPEDTSDGPILAAFARHQGGDKGFGPALGPDAAKVAGQLLDRFGYRVVAERSDWRLGPEDSALQEALAEGQAGAASEAQPSLAEEARLWLGRRRAWIAAGESRLRIGHRDLLAEPPLPPRRS